MMLPIPIFLQLVQDPAVTAPVVPVVAAVVTSYTAGEVLLFFGAASGIIAAIGAVIVNIIVALRQGHKMDAQGKKTDDLVVAVEKVHEVTNSGLSAVKTELAAARAELATLHTLNFQLREVIADLKSERKVRAISEARELPVASPFGDGAEFRTADAAATVATAATVAAVTVAAAAADATAATTEQLKQIEHNTAETVEVLKDHRS